MFSPLLRSGKFLVENPLVTVHNISVTETELFIHYSHDKCKQRLTVSRKFPLPCMEWAQNYH